jgi:ABC-type transport system involved in cytochrome bd biosynthesis fused ATPase/permease subunit
MSVVPQRVHLFSATLRDNLLLAAPELMTRSAPPLRRWAWKNCWKMAD